MDADNQLRRDFAQRNPGWTVEVVPLYRHVENGRMIPGPFFNAIARRRGLGIGAVVREDTGQSISDAFAAVEPERHAE